MVLKWLLACRGDRREALAIFRRLKSGGLGIWEVQRRADSGGEKKRRKKKKKEKKKARRFTLGVLIKPARQHVGLHVQAVSSDSFY